MTSKPNKAEEITQMIQNNEFNLDSWKALCNKDGQFAFCVIGFDPRTRRTTIYSAQTLPEIQSVLGQALQNLIMETEIRLRGKGLQKNGSNLKK